MADATPRMISGISVARGSGLLHAIAARGGKKQTDGVEKFECYTRFPGPTTLFGRPPGCPSLADARLPLVTAPSTPLEPSRRAAPHGPG